MQAYKLCKEIGLGFADLKKELKDVAGDMGIDLKKLRPMSTFSDEQITEIRLMYQKSEPAKESPSRKASTPWKPARLLDIPEHLKDPSFTYRWCTTNKPGNIRKKQSEGWIIDKELSKKLATDLVPTIEDGKPLDGVVGIRELIVMKIPNEKAQARKEFYQQRGEMATQAKQQELDNEVRRLGGETYGNIKEQRG